MGSRGPQSFKKRQKEQQRKEKQQEKMAKRLERKLHPGSTEEENVEGPADGRFHDHLDGYVDTHAEPSAPADQN
jgi:hypothetical protein